MGVQISPSILSADFARPRRRVRAGRRCCRLAARRRHGQPLRAEPDARPAGRRGARWRRSPTAGRLPPDDRGPRPVGTGVRRGRCRLGHLPRRGGRCPGAAGPVAARRRSARRHGPQARHPDRAVRRPAARDRHGAADDRRAGIRRPVVPRRRACRRSAAPGSCCVAGTTSTCGCRSTAASTPAPSRSPPRPAPTCSSPARRCTAPTTRPRPRAGSAPRRRPRPAPPGGAPASLTPDGGARAAAPRSADARGGCVTLDRYERNTCSRVPSSVQLRTVGSPRPGGATPRAVRS